MGRMKAYYYDLVEAEMHKEEINQEIAELRLQDQFEELSEDDKEILFSGSESFNQDINTWVDEYYEEYIKNQVEQGKQIFGPQKIKKGA